MPESHVGSELVQRGWRQGSLFPAAAAPAAWLALPAAEPAPAPQPPTTPADPPGWELRSAPLAADDYLVVATQTCDLARAPQAEPYVEVLRAYWTADRQLLHEASWNSIRRFLLQRRALPDAPPQGLIADATVRLQIEKAALLAITPQVGVDERDPIAFGRFRRWLAQRYGRQAIDDPLIVAVQKPIVDGLRKLRATDPLRRTLDSIREVRYVVHNDAVPFAVELWLIPDEPGHGAPPPDDESAAALAAQLATWLDQGGQATLVRWDLYDLTQLSAHDYLLAYPLPLEHYSDLPDPDEPSRTL